MATSLSRYSYPYIPLHSKLTTCSGPRENHLWRGLQVYLTNSPGTETDLYSVASIQVYSVEVQTVPCAWLKERRIFNQNGFLVHAQTILEVIVFFVQFTSTSLLEFVPKRLIFCAGESPGNTSEGKRENQWRHVPSHVPLSTSIYHQSGNYINSYFTWY